MRRFRCEDRLGGLQYNSNSQPYYNLLYNLTFEDRTVLLTEQLLREYLVAEFFREGRNFLPNITVCRLNSPRMECDPLSLPLVVRLVNVTIQVMHNRDRFFPYGPATDDQSVHGVIDGTVLMTPPSGFAIPFFQGNYRALYVSCCNYVAK